MKKKLHKLRVWLIRKLGGVPNEIEKTAFETVLEENAKLYKKISDRDSRLEILRWQVKALRKVIREICRRSETSYYDWCCEYCATPCDRRNGWCHRFKPRHDL